MLMPNFGGQKKEYYGIFESGLLAITCDIHEVKVMFFHNKPLFRARSEGLGRLAHSVYSLIF